MESHYQATPEQWAIIASRAASANGSRYTVDAENAAPHSCLLELRKRMEALEATQHAHADTSGLSNEERNAVAEQLREPGGFVQFKVETSYGEENAHAKDLLRTMSVRPVMVEGSFDLHGKTYEYKAEAQPAANAQPLTLVDRMADLIDPDDPIAARGTARAAVRVVAEWVRENPGPNSAWPAVARDLMDEASR